MEAPHASDDAAAEYSVPSGSQPGIVMYEPPVTLSEDLYKAMLARIKLTGTVLSPCLDTLHRLVEAFTTNIAYETIGITLGEAPVPSTQEDAAVERCSIQRRGGYCFLVVPAFAALLTRVGFKYSLHTAAVGTQPIAASVWGNHVVLVVHLAEGGKWVADVGLGDGPKRCFELVEHEWVEDQMYRFSVQPVEDKPGGCGPPPPLPHVLNTTLYPRITGQWWFHHDPCGSFQGFLLDVSTSVASWREFQAYHEHYWQSPESNYAKSGLVVQRKCKQGVLILRSLTLRLVLPTRTTILTTATSEEELFRILEEEFLLARESFDREQRKALFARCERDHSAWVSRKAGCA